MQIIREQIRPAAVLLALFTVITGLLYPGVVTVAAQLAFPEQANGSLIAKDSRTIGSTLIGQPFASDRYFWSRPSATGPVPYNGAASSGSNLGPLNPDLQKALIDRISVLKASAPDNHTAIPVDLVTASASGLDPHISPAAALWQVSRIAKARTIPEEQVTALIHANTEERVMGLIGEPVVNVVKLNLALDALN